MVTKNVQGEKMMDLPKHLTIITTRLILVNFQLSSKTLEFQISEFEI